MTNAKKAVVFGSFGAAAYFFITGKRFPGFALAGVGLAVLAAEHPEKAEELWNNAPRYLTQMQEQLTNVSHFLEQLAEKGRDFEVIRGGREEIS